MQNGAETVEVADVQAVGVDPRRREHPDADPFGTTDDSAEQLLALLGGQLLGVVQECERPDLGAAQGFVVEQDAGYE